MLDPVNMLTCMFGGRVLPSVITFSCIEVQSFNTYNEASVVYF